MLGERFVELAHALAQRLVGGPFAAVGRALQRLHFRAGRMFMMVIVMVVVMVIVRMTARLGSGQGRAGQGQNKNRTKSHAHDLNAPSRDCALQIHIKAWQCPCKRPPVYAAQMASSSLRTRPARYWA